jgi:hypothetical protein
VLNAIFQIYLLDFIKKDWLMVSLYTRLIYLNQLIDFYES